MGKSIKLFVGMDVHKDSIDVATGDERGGEVRHYGAIGGELAAVTRLARKLESAGGPLIFVYEAGPCGFDIYRMLCARGHECWVVSPGLTPRSNADRIKTDRRDCLKLARLTVQRRAAFGASVATACWAACADQGLIFTSFGPIARSATSVS